MKVFEKMGRYFLIEALFSAVLGLFLLMAPRSTMRTVIYLAAAFLAVNGIVNLISHVSARRKLAQTQENPPRTSGFLVSGVLQLLGALTLFFFSTSVAALLPIALGVVVIISSLVNMIYAVDIRKAGDPQWIWLLLYGLLTAIAGVVIVLNPFSSLVIFTRACGIVMLVRAAGDVATCLAVRKIRKNL